MATKNNAVVSEYDKKPQTELWVYYRFDVHLCSICVAYQLRQRTRDHAALTKTTQIEWYSTVMENQSIRGE